MSVVGDTPVPSPSREGEDEFSLSDSHSDDGSSTIKDVLILTSGIRVNKWLGGKIKMERGFCVTAPAYAEERWFCLAEDVDTAAIQEWHRNDHGLDEDCLRSHDQWVEEYKQRSRGKAYMKKVNYFYPEVPYTDKAFKLIREKWEAALDGTAAPAQDQEKPVQDENEEPFELPKSMSPQESDCLEDEVVEDDSCDEVDVDSWSDDDFASQSGGSDDGGTQCYGTTGYSPRRDSPLPDFQAGGFADEEWIAPEAEEEDKEQVEGGNEEMQRLGKEDLQRLVRIKPDDGRQVLYRVSEHCLVRLDTVMTTDVNPLAALGARYAGVEAVLHGSNQENEACVTILPGDILHDTKGNNFVFLTASHDYIDPVLDESGTMSDIIFFDCLKLRKTGRNKQIKKYVVDAPKSGPPILSLKASDFELVESVYEILVTDENAHHSAEGKSYVDLIRSAYDSTNAFIRTDANFSHYREMHNLFGGPSPVEDLVKWSGMQEMDRLLVVLEHASWDIKLTSEEPFKGMPTISREAMRVATTNYYDMLKRGGELASIAFDRLLTLDMYPLTLPKVGRGGKAPAPKQADNQADKAGGRAGAKGKQAKDAVHEGPTSHLGRGKRVRATPPKSPPKKIYDSPVKKKGKRGRKPGKMPKKKTATSRKPCTRGSNQEKDNELKAASKIFMDEVEKAVTQRSKKGGVEAFLDMMASPPRKTKNIPVDIAEEAAHADAKKKIEEMEASEVRLKMEGISNFAEAQKAKQELLNVKAKLEASEATVLDLKTRLLVQEQQLKEKAAQCESEMSTSANFRADGEKYKALYELAMQNKTEFKSMLTSELEKRG
jgi:hypothetical protein